MASSRRLPASYNTSTFGGVTRDYQSFAVWEAATDIDISVATGTGVGEGLFCYADAANYDQRVDIGGATTDINSFRFLTAVSGQGNTGILGTGFQVNYTGASTTIFNLGEPYFGLYDLEIVATTNQATNVIPVFLAGDNTKLVGNIVTGANAGAGTVTAGIRVNSNITHYLINNLVYECVGGNGVQLDNGTGYVYNNTIVDNPGFGITITGVASISIKNNIVQDNGADIGGTPAASVTNVTSGVIFQDAAADNYLLDPTDAAAQGQGTDLSGDANYSFNDDVLKNTRLAPWTVGMHDLAASTPKSSSGRRSMLHYYLLRRNG